MTDHHHEAERLTSKGSNRLKLALGIVLVIMTAEVRGK